MKEWSTETLVSWISLPQCPKVSSVTTICDLIPRYHLGLLTNDSAIQWSQKTTCMYKIKYSLLMNVHCTCTLFTTLNSLESSFTPKQYIFIHTNTYMYMLSLTHNSHIASTESTHMHTDCPCRWTGLWGSDSPGVAMPPSFMVNLEWGGLVDWEALTDIWVEFHWLL